MPFNLYWLISSSGECSADPTLCRSGITISFWLKMEQNAIAKMKSQGFNEFYVWASGGLQIKSRYSQPYNIFRIHFLFVLTSLFQFERRKPLSFMILKSSFGFVLQISDIFTLFRGFALVYQNGGFELHLQHSKGGHVIKMTSFVYSKWFHISFTWSGKSLSYSFLSFVDLWMEQKHIVWQNQCYLLL